VFEETSRLRGRVAELEARLAWCGGSGSRDAAAGEPLSTVFENARMAMLVVDEGRRCVDANPAACTLTGYGREELLGRELGLLYGGIPELSTDPETGAAEDMTFLPECLLTRKDGARLWIEITRLPFVMGGRRLALEILRDISGRKQSAGSFGTIRNQLERRIEESAHDLEVANAQLKREIEERRRAETELKRTKEYLENIIENSVDAIGIVDREGRFILWNRRAVEIYGYHSDDLAGKSSFDLYADRAELDRMLERLMAATEFVSENAEEIRRRMREALPRLADRASENGRAFARMIASRFPS